MNNYFVIFFRSLKFGLINARYLNKYYVEYLKKLEKLKYLHITIETDDPTEHGPRGDGWYAILAQIAGSVPNLEKFGFKLIRFCDPDLYQNFISTFCQLYPERKLLLKEWKYVAVKFFNIKLLLKSSYVNLF